MKNEHELQIKRKLMLLAQGGHYSEAEKLAKQFLYLKEDDQEVWYALGQLQNAQGKINDAAYAFELATKKVSKHYLAGLDQLIGLYMTLGYFEKGLKCSEKRLKKDSKDAWAHYRKGFCLLRLGRSIEGLVSIERAHKLAPEDKKLHAFYAKTLGMNGHGELAIEEYEKEELYLNHITDYTRYLEFHNYCGNISDPKIFENFSKFGKYIKRTTSANEEPLFKIDKTRKIRIGYLSPDFKQHAVGYFLKSIFKMHDKNAFEIFVYSDTDSKCKENTFFREAADSWRDAYLLSDTELLDQIRKDQIDILVDLAVYTAQRPRIMIFAQRAAPIQVNYLGFPNTSGVENMDYRLVDGYTDPFGEADHINTEQLVRLNPSFLCFSWQSAPTPDVVDLPAERNQFITLGSFNNGQKITDKQLSLWGKVLQAIPNSKLIIKNSILFDDEARKQYRKRCTALGVDTKRLSLIGPTKEIFNHLELYNQVDIHLDTHPYTGTTTTFEALWMGVPTVTLEGSSHRSRVSASILNALGLNKFITNTEEDYINRIEELSADITGLSQVRQNLRSLLENSLLMNEKHFIGQLEGFYKEAFEAYPEKIRVSTDH